MTVLKLIAGGPWIVIFYGQQGGTDQPDITATSIDLVGGGVVGVAATIPGTALLNLLTNIQRADIEGTIGDDLLDASGFTGGLGRVPRRPRRRRPVGTPARTR